MQVSNIEGVQLQKKKVKGIIFSLSKSNETNKTTRPKEVKQQQIAID